jgi:hypothetical protein
MACSKLLIPKQTKYENNAELDEGDGRSGMTIKAEKKEKTTVEKEKEQIH